MRSMQWQLGILGTISAFAYRHRETKKTLCRGGGSQDLPNTDFLPAVRHLKQKQQCTRVTTNTHKMTTIHTRRLTTIDKRHLKIQHVQKLNNTKVRKYCIQFLEFFPTHIELTLSPQPFTSHHFTTHINFSHKVTFLPPSQHCPLLHFTSKIHYRVSKSLSLVSVQKYQNLSFIFE